MGDHQGDLYGVWKPVWAQEELDRGAAWKEVLLRSTIRESGKAYDLAELAGLGLQDVITQAQHSTGTDHELRPTVEALVQTGFPMAIRGLGWKIMLDVSVRRHKGHYNVLVQSALGQLACMDTVSAEDIKLHLGQRDDDAQDWSAHAKVWLQQIEKDLPRTFSGHPVMEGAGRQALRRVLAAFTMHDPVVGYCQGMNFIAAVLLMFMSEEDAFWCLVIVVEDVLTGYFLPDMMAAKVDQRVFQRLVSQQLPTVAVHLEAMGADLACVAPQWFLCAFVNSLPLETCLRVWDVLFYRKTSAILFQVGLALVDVYSEALLMARDVLEAFQVVQGMAALTHDASHLLAVAGVKFSALDDQHLSSLRAQAQAQVKKQEAEDERAEADRQLKQQTAMDMAVSKQQQAPQALPADSRLTVVKKLLARLDKRADSAGNSVGGRGSDGAAERLAGAGAGGGDSDSDQEPGRIRSQDTALAGRPVSRRAGNHTVPDSNDSPLLKVPVAVGPSLVAPEGIEQADEGDEDEEEGGSYVPPSVPLFPEAKELISLSPTESAVVPDIDDLLRASSLRRGTGDATATTARPPLQKQPGVDGGSSGDLAVNRAEQSPAEEEEGDEEVVPSAASTGQEAGVARVASREGLSAEASAEERPGTPSLVAKDTRLQQLDAMLWHETPPWKSLTQFSAAQRGLDSTTAAPEGTAETSAKPTSTVSPEQTGVLGPPMADAQAPAPSEGHKSRARQDGASRNSTGQQSSRGPQSKLSQSSQPQPSPAMQAALRIAMHKPECDSAASTGRGANQLDPASLFPPQRDPTLPQTQHDIVTSSFRQEASNPEGLGSANSTRSLGISSVPTEDLLEALSLAGALGGGGGGGGGQALQQSAAGHSGTLMSGVGTGAELKDDWVDLHVGEDLLHSAAGRLQHQQPQQGGRSWLPPGQGMGAHVLPGMQLFASANGASLAPHGHPLSQSLQHPLQQPIQHVHHSPQHAQQSSELRKTISNGWVDGALPSHPPLTSFSSSGAVPGGPSPSAPSPLFPLMSMPHPLALPGEQTLSFGGVPGPGDFGLSLPPIPLSPLEREGLAQPGAAAGPLDRSWAQAGLPVSSRPAPGAVEELCEREGIQPLLQRCNTLNKQYKRVEAGRAGGDRRGGSEDEADMQSTPRHAGARGHGPPTPSVSSRTLDQALSTTSMQPTTSNYHRLLGSLLEHVGEALAQMNVVVRNTPGGARIDRTDTAHPADASAHEAADHADTSHSNATAPAEDGSAMMAAPHPDARSQAAAAAVFSLQVAHQQLSEALEDSTQAEQVEQELLRNYRSLANASCQKLHDVAGTLAEKEALNEAMSNQLNTLTQTYVAKEERLVDKLSDQEDALKDMQHRLASMATNSSQTGGSGAGAGPGTAAGEGNRLLGAFQKLRERSSRPSSPPVRRNGSGQTPPPVVHPLLAPQADHPGFGWQQQQQQTVAAGGPAEAPPAVLLTGWGSVRMDDGSTASREEGRVTKWLNRFMKKEDEGT